MGLWDRTWGIPGLGGGPGRVEREEPGCPGRQGAELPLASFCKLRRGPVQPTHWGANFLPCSRGPKGSETYVPFLSGLPGLPPQAGSLLPRCFGKSSSTTTLSLRPGAGAGRPVSGPKVGWWPGRAGRRGMQIRIRATGWAIIDSARPGSGPGGGGEGRGAGARGADVGGGLEAWRQGARRAPSLGSEQPPARLLARRTARPWAVAAVGSWETRVQGSVGPGLCEVGVG